MVMLTVADKHAIVQEPEYAVNYSWSGGPEPITDSFDEDGSYGNWHRVYISSIPALYGIGATFQPRTLSVVKAAIVRVQIRPRSDQHLGRTEDDRYGPDGHPACDATLSGVDADGFGWVQTRTFSAPIDTWSVQTIEYSDSFFNADRVRESSTNGTLLARGNCRSWGFDLSAVSVEIIGDTYLRNHARTDGLGGNAPRNHQVTSQQRSLRNKGYR